MTETELKLLDLLMKVLSGSQLTQDVKGNVIRMAPDHLWDEVSETLAVYGR